MNVLKGCSAEGLFAYQCPGLSCKSLCDISPILVQVCSALHQRYTEFSQELVPAIAVNLTPQAGERWHR